MSVLQQKGGRLDVECLLVWRINCLRWLKNIQSLVSAHDTKKQETMNLSFTG